MTDKFCWICDVATTSYWCNISTSLRRNITKNLRRNCDATSWRRIYDETATSWRRIYDETATSYIRRPASYMDVTLRRICDVAATKIRRICDVVATSQIRPEPTGCILYNFNRARCKANSGVLLCSQACSDFEHSFWNIELRRRWK